MTNRDDFSPATKRTLAARAGGHCSNPICRNLTSGPEVNDNGSVNLGKAAHINSAAPGGCRFNPDLTAEERSGIENGVWLCTKCADLIDKQEKDYPVEILLEWKRHAETAARTGLETPHLFASGQVNTYTLAMVYRFKKPSRFFEIYKRSAPPGMEYCQPLKLSPLPGQSEFPVKEFMIPQLLDASFGPSPSATAFVLMLQNRGTATEPQASITLRIDGIPIWNQTLQSSDRCARFAQSTAQGPAGMAGFSVSNLMPNEWLISTVYSHKTGPFHAEYFFSSTARTGTPMLFDVHFGEPELVPRLQRNPEFEKEQFPFD